VAALVWVAPNAASARQDLQSGAPDATIDMPPATTPEPTTPEPTTPDSTPDSIPSTSEKDGPTSTTPDDEALVGAGDPDSEVDSTAALIAVVGFVLLVALAGWWMVRRSDPDAEPMPRNDPDAGPPSDLI
jgi:hypothetical protein